MKAIHLCFAWSPCRAVILSLCLLSSVVCSRGAEEKFDVLQAGSDVYSNVTVVSKTGTDIFVSHASGIATIKLKNLSDDVLDKLGYVVKEPSRPNPLAQLEADPRVQAAKEEAARQIAGVVEQLDPRWLYALAGGLIAIFLFFSWCSLLICQKAGYTPGVLIWVPVFQMIPLFKAARMSGWSLLLLFIPVANLIVSIVWCVKICQARNKSPLVAVLLLLPVTGLFAFLYLAFADSTPGQEEEEALVRLKYSA